MGDWQPFSVRTGKKAPQAALQEGIPDHLRYQIEEWLNAALDAGGEDAAKIIAARLSVPLPRANYTAISQLFAAARADDQLCLDVLDMVLRLQLHDHNELDQYLSLGGSAYTATPGALETRTTDQERGAYEAARLPADDVADEIRQAWQHAFGMHPDPSDAWDHAIKAVEALLAPIIIPANLKATLGTILAAIEQKPSKWTFGMEPSGPSSDMEVLAQLLHLLWPNPDRHAGNSPRTPRQDEAERVVHTAVLVINLSRGHLTAIGP